MATTDDALDANSRRLLGEIDELRRLEREKRATARSSEDFHRLAEQVEATARHVFDIAHEQQVEGDEDSPIPAERAEKHPGDWAEGSRN